MTASVISDHWYSLEQNRAIIARACPDCPSQRREVCCDVPEGHHHVSRVAAWLASLAPRSAS